MSNNSNQIDGSLPGKFFVSDSIGDISSQLSSFGANSNGNVTLSYGSITSGYCGFQFTSNSPAGITCSEQVSARVPAPAVLGCLRA